MHMLGMQVAMGAAEVLFDQLQSIRQLRPQGAQQLAADLEYFCNVLSALGVAAPAALATWQACPLLLCLPLRLAAVKTMPSMLSSLGVAAHVLRRAKLCLRVGSAPAC